MKRETRHSSGRKLRGLFCLGLAAVLAAGIAFNSAAANAEPMQYDVSVWSSSTHTAALSGGKLYCWGTNSSGQFPNSTLTYSAEPLSLVGGIADAAVSKGRTLTVSTNGKLRSYGVDPATGKEAPQSGTLLAEDAAQVEASDNFAAYVSKAGALYTWGSNDFGQLGTGNTDTAEEPVQVFDKGVKKVSLGEYFSLALMEDGSVYGWGRDASLEFGYEKDGQPVSSVTEPVLVAEDVKDIATGDRHSCLLKNNGSLWTCGENNYSQTGVEDADATGSLTQILEGVRSVSAGSLHNFAVCTDGSVYAWGYGLSGQLGAGNGERQTVPTLTDFDYVQVFACDDNTFGVTAKGYLYSFGDNTNYRLGKSDGTDSLTPMCILDKDMNWVYDEFKDGAGPDYAVDGNTTPNNAPSVSEPEVSEPEVTEPEIVSTPFIRGYGDNTFRPNGSITRAEFVKMLVTALCDDYEPGPDNNNYGACTFTDVSVGAWYNPYLAYAQQKESSDGEKYVSGYKDGTFNPNGTITRAEAAKVTAVFLDLDIKSAPDAEYDDVDPENWSAPYINALTQNGAIQGDGNGLFRPKGNITRAEAAKIVAAALNFRPNAIEEEELLSSVSECPFTDVDPEKWYYVYLLRGVGYVK